MTETRGLAAGVIGAKGSRAASAEERSWIVRGGLGLAAAHAVEALALVALAPWLLARLGPGGFGIWVAVTAAAAVAGLLDSGVGSAPGRLVARAAASERGDRVRALVTTAVAAQLVQSAALLAVGWLAAPAVAEAVAAPAEEAATESALRMALAAVLALRLATVFDGALVGLGRVGALAAIRTGRTLLYVALAIPAATIGLEAVLAAQLIVQSTALVATAAAARIAHGAPLLARGSTSRETLRELLRYGVPRQAATVASVLAQRGGPLAAALFVGPIAAGEAGFAFLACAGLAMLLAQAAAPLTRTLAQIAVRDAPRLAARYRTALFAASVAAGAAFGALAAAAPALVRALAGDELGGAAEAIRWLAPGFALYAVANVASIGGQAAGRPELEGRAAAGGAMLVAALATAGAAAFGAAGAAAGTSLGLAIWATLYLRSLGRTSLGGPSLAVLWPIAIAGLLAAALAVGGDRMLDPASLSRAGALAAAAGQAALHVALLVAALALAGAWANADSSSGSSTSDCAHSMARSGP